MMETQGLDRVTMIDSRSYAQCTLQPKGTSTGLLDKSFFYRTHSMWNHLPLDVREITCNLSFKNKVTEHLWSQLLATDDPDMGIGDFDLSGSQ